MTIVKHCELPVDRMLHLLRTMELIRCAENKINDLNKVHTFHGTNHLCTGQEASCVGLCAALCDEDYLIATHRGHGMYLAKCHDNINAMMCEMFGLNDGMCRGLGGSMHFSDLKHGYICSTGVVAGGVPIAVGMALNIKYNKGKNIAVVAFGDGASNQGMAFESMNLASFLSVPVLFYCENNMYAVSSRSDEFVANTTIYERARGFGLKSIQIDGNKLDEVYDAVCEAKNFIISTGKPYFIEAKTYRYVGHSRSDKLFYRTSDEEQEHKKDDPIEYYCKLLLKDGVVNDKILDDIQKKVNNDIDDALSFCEQNKIEITFEDAKSFVYPQMRRPK